MVFTTRKLLSWSKTKPCRTRANWCSRVALKLDFSEGDRFCSPFVFAHDGMRVFLHVGNSWRQQAVGKTGREFVMIRNASVARWFHGPLPTWRQIIEYAKRQIRASFFRTDASAFCRAKISSRLSFSSIFFLTIPNLKSFRVKTDSPGRVTRNHSPETTTHVLGGI